MNELAGLGSNIRVVNQINRVSQPQETEAASSRPASTSRFSDADDVCYRENCGSKYASGSPPASGCRLLPAINWRPEPGGSTWMKPERLPGASDTDGDVKRLHYAEFPLYHSGRALDDGHQKTGMEAIGGFDETCSTPKTSTLISDCRELSR